MSDADRQRDPDHSDDDVALKRNPRLERVRDEVQVLLDNLAPEEDSKVRHAAEDLLDEVETTISKQTGPSKKDVDEQREREEELKKPL